MGLKVHVEFDGQFADFEGEADEVTKAFVKFINNTYPAFRVAQRLIFKPDLIKLAESLVDIIEIAPEGLMFLPDQQLPIITIALSSIGN